MNTWDETYNSLIKTLSSEYKRHEYLLNIIKDENEKNTFTKIMNQKGTFADYASSMKNLCMYLEKYYNQKPIVLIDEYDVPLQNSYLRGFYDEAINFIRALLQEVLKDNTREHCCKKF